MQSHQITDLLDSYVWIWHCILYFKALPHLEELVLFLRAGLRCPLKDPKAALNPLNSPHDFGKPLALSADQMLGSSRLVWQIELA